ncbi:hypothetical protein BsWGS_19647 [Bradybaena similaris]
MKISDGRVSWDSLPLIADVLRQTWAATNSEIQRDDIRVSVLNMDASSSVSLDTSAVTVVDYQVTVDQADSSLTTAEEPSMSAVQQMFSDRTSLSVCGCQTRNLLNISTWGHMDPNSGDHLETVRKALMDSWTEANKNYTGSVKVNVLSILPLENNTAEQTREQERIVVFTVDPDPDGLEDTITDLDLLQPDSEVINTHFRKNNLDISISGGEGHSVDGDNGTPFPWYIPVGVILALLLIVVIVCIFCCICWESRKRDSKEIDNNPEDFREDNFDKEHFTMEPVAFENEAFHAIDTDRIPEVIQRGKTDL